MAGGSAGVRYRSILRNHVAICVSRTRTSPRLQSSLLYWSSIRLDTDPLNRRNLDEPQVDSSCKEADEGCIKWNPEAIWIEPGSARKHVRVFCRSSVSCGSTASTSSGTLGTQCDSSIYDLCTHPDSRVVLRCWSVPRSASEAPTTSNWRLILALLTINLDTTSYLRDFGRPVPFLLRRLS